MRTRIISAFLGTGKSHYHKLHPDTTLDSDSSKFGWGISDKGERWRMPNWVDFYIQHIKENIGKYEIIFVSSHKKVREALLNNCIFFYLFYPKLHQKEKFIERYKQRGSDEAFIKLLSENWNTWIDDLSDPIKGCEPIEMVFPYLDKEIDHLIRSENGDSL